MLTSSYLQFGEPVPIRVLFDRKSRRFYRDTVGSVGVIPKRLPFTTFNTHVKHFRQALALDEHRVRFKPNFFNRPTPEEVELGLKWGQGHQGEKKRSPQLNKNKRAWETQYARKGLHSTDVEEVWFAGCHCGKLLLDFKYSYV